MALDTDPFSDQEILAKTIWGEDRGGGTSGMSAVASVVLNRVNSGITWWGTDIRSVCLAPFQMSCWNRNDPNRAKLLAVTSDDPQYVEALDIAEDAINGDLEDNTNGATSYFVKDMPNPPKWCESMIPCAEIGAHVFYKNPT